MRVWAVLAAVLVVGAGAVGAYFLWRPQETVIPAVNTEGRDPEVVAAVDSGRADIASRPRSADAWGRLGMVLFAQDMYGESIPFLAEAQRLDPNEVRWPYYLALALILQRPDEGIAALQRAAALAPRSSTVKLRLAEEYLKLDRLDDADALYGELLATQSDDPRALLGRGMILSRRGQWSQAVEPLKKAAEYPTARHAAHVALAEAYERVGNRSAAEAERARAAESPPDALWPDTFLAEAEKLRLGQQPGIDRALRLLDSGQDAEAVNAAAQLVRKYPESHKAYLTQARIFIQLRQFNEAQLALRKSIELNPNLVDAYFLLGGAQISQNDYASAQLSLVRAIELKPNHGVAHYNLGQCWLKLGQRDKAIEEFREAVRCLPDLPAMHLELAAALLDAGRTDEAIARIEDALRLDQNNERARALLEQTRAKKKSPGGGARQSRPPERR
jgi:tetratricopeptide (TPR) repeat protein